MKTLHVQLDQIQLHFIVKYEIYWMNGSGNYNNNDNNKNDKHFGFTSLV